MSKNDGGGFWNKQLLRLHGKLCVVIYIYISFLNNVLVLLNILCVFFFNLTVLLETSFGLVFCFLIWNRVWNEANRTFNSFHVTSSSIKGYCIHTHIFVRIEVHHSGEDIKFSFQWLSYPKIFTEPGSSPLVHTMHRNKFNLIEA